MGSYWAYYELGWGGFWFWDPVENASLMPWLAATALLHSAVVMEKRDALKIWTVLLAILAFSLSLLGTFLVRSGVLTSVHAFASDPTRGIFILAILCLFIGGALTLFAFRAGALAPGGIFAPISREGALILNNLFLTAAAATVIIGTLYPLVLEALTGDAHLGRRAVLQPDLRAAGRAAAPHRAVRAAARLEARRPPRRRGAADVRLRRRARRGDRRGGASPARRSSLALFGVGLGVWLIAGALSELAFRVRLGARAARREPAPRSPACRARPSARRSPMPASA